MIKLFALDIDGTLTDDGVYMDGKGGEFKRFSVRDGYGIVMLKKAGIKVAFISGRYSAATQQRADNLKVDACINGTQTKLEDLKKLAEQWSIKQEEIAYAGDDIPDVECLTWSRMGMVPANASRPAKKAANWISSENGGFGAVREFAEKILELNESEK
ncbi:MAG: HAD-IIIA family hydrolase [Synergistaceae bacterium]|nr:HAD-IIIA family hydrolase [Candidatus Equadaptatus faecalis]